MITVILAALLGCSTTETATAPAVTEAATTPTAVEVTPATTATTTTTTEGSETCVDLTDDGVDQCAQSEAGTTSAVPVTATTVGPVAPPASSTTAAH
jgi:hypothetical protein